MDWMSPSYRILSSRLSLPSVIPERINASTLGELERRVDSGEMQVAFSMFPTAMDELMAVADAGRTMPPKSTWFEPKLRSGLFIHDLGE